MLFPIVVVVFPLNQHEDKQIINLRISLRKTKENKLQKLLGKDSATNRKPQGFKNLSTTTFDDDLSSLLNKGPSFVSPQPNELSKLCLLSKPNLQTVTDLLTRDEVPESAVNEFKGGMIRVINECMKVGPTILKHKNTSYKPPPDNVVIIPSDKSKRLIALDHSSYEEMIKQATIEIGNYEMLKKFNQPRTEQINFNGKLNQIANKYKRNDSKLYTALR